MHLKAALNAVIAVVFWLTTPTHAFAQELHISTVERPPFSMQQGDEIVGFSVDLLSAVMQDVGKDYTLTLEDSFSGMLERVSAGDIDAAIANISITAQREQMMDFTQPIFASGLQIMSNGDASAGSSVLRVILSFDLLLAVLAAFAVLLGGGMLMWWFERGKQEYFDRPASEAGFPAFWWALNLVVNGGFEERVPRSVFGRIFGVFLVISSLFVVSIFVARITSVMTVDAIQSSVSSISDLHGKSVATIEGSTASAFLDTREIRHLSAADLNELFEMFESEAVEAVVFDAPVLAYYITTHRETNAELAGQVFLRENYGIALPSGSDLAEPINQSLLKLRENGTYADIHRTWFGALPGGG